MDSSSLMRVSLVGVHSLHVGTSWMDLIIAFLKQRLLPKDKCEAEVVQAFLFRTIFVMRTPEGNRAFVERVT